MIYRRFTFKLEPSTEQIVKFRQHAGVCRLVYNLALEQRSIWWRQYQKTTGYTLNYVAQARQLTKLRAEFEFIREVSQVAEQMALKALDNAFKNFFNGTSEYPKPHKKGIHERFSFTGRRVDIKKLNRSKGYIKLPKIGSVKFRGYRYLEGPITAATVFNTVTGWHVTIGTVLTSRVALPTGAVGIDRGVAVPLMLSDGKTYKLPVAVDEIARKIDETKRRNSTRRKNSIRHTADKLRISKLSARQARIRKDWAHRTTTEICASYGTIVVEKLRTKDIISTTRDITMGLNRKIRHRAVLNKAILNVGWRQIETMLAYKAVKLIRVNPAYTSQTCASCGTVDKRSRENQASFVCTACGHRDNADRNAAINILNRGNTVGA